MTAYIAVICGFAAQHDLIWGVCGPEPLAHPNIEADTPFLKKSAVSRTDPSAVLPGVQSVIALGLFYPRLPAFKRDEHPRGVLSAGAIGTDYHITLGHLLARLAQMLPGESRTAVDSGPLAERAFAHRAGLGFFGSHCCLIAPERGSFFNIGLLLTGLPLPPSKPLSLRAALCADCGKCVAACPGGALSGGGIPRLNARACAAYLTQKKGPLTEGEARVIGTRLYGCDVCQNVCPYNAAAPYAEADVDTAMPKLDRVLALTDADFKRQYGDSALFWRGRETLQRNARIALHNNAENRQ